MLSRAWSHNHLVCDCEKDVECTTHLTVDRGRGIKTNDVKYHGDKGGHACEGINLCKLLISPKGTRWKVSAKKVHCGPISSIGRADAL
jgi:hypothetical protein